MGAVTAMVTDAMRRKAEQLAEEATSWLPATSRVNGRRFFIVPNSTGSAAYYCDFNQCTCRGHQWRGICSHVEAIRSVERRRMAEMAESAWQKENDELFAGFTRTDVEPAPALPEPKPVVAKRGYRDLFPDDDSLCDAF